MVKWKLFLIPINYLFIKRRHRAEKSIPYALIANSRNLTAHGFRKFFSTELIEADVKTELRWLLEGHNLKGNDSNYVRTTPKRLQQEYEKAIDNLTIDPNQRLRKKIETLQVEKSRIDMLEAKIQKLERKHGKIR